MSKILLISHIFPPAIDGGSRVIYKLGQQLKARGHTTLYLSSNRSSTDDFVKLKYQKSKTLTSNQIKLPVYTFLRKPLKLLEIICIRFLFINPKSYFINLIKVLQKGPIFKLFPFLKATIKIIKFKPDIIVAGPLPTTIVLYASFFKIIINKINFPLSSKGNAPQWRGRGFCKVLINSSFHPTDPDFQLLPLIHSLQKADYLWTLTQFETNYFINNFKINPDKIILAGNGVDSDFLIKKTKIKKSTIYNRRSKILFIGSLSSHKRVELLLNSFSTIYHLRSNISLTIAGQKTLYYPKIKETFDSLEPKIKSRIKFIFDFPQNKLAQLIDNCVFLVLPSIQESFGLVIIESWARGKPVIVSDIPSLSELINQSQGGLIFKQDNQIDLQNQMKKLIDSPQSCYQYGQNGLKYVKTNYLWKKVSQKICQKLKLS